MAGKEFKDQQVIKDGEKKIRAVTREMLQRWIGDSVWVGGRRREFGGKRLKFT